MTALRSHAADVMLGAAVAAVSVIGLVGVEDPPGGLAVNLVYPVAIGALVAARRRAPVPTALAFALLSVPQTAWLVSPKFLAGSFICLLIFPFNAGAHAGRAGPLVPPAMVALYATVEAWDSGRLLFTDAAFPAVLSFATYLAGRALRSRTRLAAELHEAAVRAEEAREASAELAIAAERRRIARELHDVVAHSISVMVVQAGGARRILDLEPGRAVAAAEQIERTGREAMAEMRRVLGVLHPGQNGAARAPQPGLDGLVGLVENARAAGLPVTIEVEGDRRPVPAGLELSAYRIVQESLTNALKHARAAPTRVRLRWTDAALEIEVADEGGARAAFAPSGAGHGLVGMRERARVFGGDLDAGPRPSGGFEVRARLPLQPEEVPA